MILVAIMDTPIWNFERTHHVYEPSEDSFLLMDALQTDLKYISEYQPTVVLEIGSGSGVVICGLSKALGRLSKAFFMAIDINSEACLMTQETGEINNAQVPLCSNL